MRGIALFSVCITVVAATCHFPDGTTIQDTACNPTAPNSTCCGPGYACLSNHICALTEHVSKDIANSFSYYVRASCTDKTWTSPECPSFCTNTSNGDNVGVGGMGVGKCDGDGGVDRYYCRNKVTADLSDEVLCKSPAYYIGFEGYPTTVTIIGVDATSAPSSVSSGRSSSAASSPVASTTATSAPSPTSSSHDKIAIGAGLGVGLGVPLALALGVIGVLLLRRGKRTASTSGNDSDSHKLYSERLNQQQPCELNANSDLHEAPANLHHELMTPNNPEKGDAAVIRALQS